MTTGIPELSNRPKLWQLISPTLPVGAFHYSQGLEAAVDRAWIHDEATAQAWIRGILHHTIAVVDLPILVRALNAWRERDLSVVRRWDRICRALRETRELRDEDHNMGLALRRLTIGLKEPVPEDSVGFVAGYAVLAANWNLAPAEAAAGYAWSWCENQVAAAIKLVPLGQTSGQRILLHLGSNIEQVVTQALDCTDEDIGRGAPGMTIASCLHETQYSKLFRS